MMPLPQCTEHIKHTNHHDKHKLMYKWHKWSKQTHKATEIKPLATEETRSASFWYGPIGLGQSLEKTIETIARLWAYEALSGTD